MTISINNNNIDNSNSEENNIKTYNNVLPKPFMGKPQKWKKKFITTTISKHNPSNVKSEENNTKTCNDDAIINIISIRIRTTLKRGGWKYRKRGDKINLWVWTTIVSAWTTNKSIKENHNYLLGLWFEEIIWNSTTNHKNI